MTLGATDMSRASDSREAQRMGIFGTSNSYGGSYGRVTNEALGRDINPLGRGGGGSWRSFSRFMDCVCDWERNLGTIQHVEAGGLMS